MISYCLAAGKEYSILLHLDQTIVTSIFGLGLGFFVIFGYWLVKPLISSLTFVKGSVLIAVVCVTVIVSLNAHVQIRNDFSRIMEPLLMSTMALGGVVNVMPMLFELLPSPQSLTQVKGFRRSIGLGVTFCYLLNVIWCWSVLNIVPQSCSETALMNGSCLISLHRAEIKGEPSTIPLKKEILQQDPSYKWATVFIQIFIIVSISVSYLTHVAAFTHTIEGFIIYLFRSKRSTILNKLNQCRLGRLCSTESAVSRIISIAALLVIVTFSLLHPDSFVVVLERLGSLILNLECGPFVFMMIVLSNSTRNKRLQIPLPLPKWFYPSAIIILLFGLFSLAFDIYGFVNSVFMSHVQHMSNGTTVS